jgi:hypothetical protein
MNFVILLIASFPAEKQLTYREYSQVKCYNGIHALADFIYDHNKTNKR